jgi:hypothetical protein
MLIITNSWGNLKTWGLLGLMGFLYFDLFNNKLFKYFIIMGNLFSKLVCDECAQQNLKPDFFEKRLTIESLRKSDLDDSYHEPEYYYVCSNGHEIHNSWSHVLLCRFI